MLKDIELHVLSSSSSMFYLRKTEKEIRNINKVFLKTHEWIGKKTHMQASVKKREKKRRKNKVYFILFSNTVVDNGSASIYYE